MRVALLTTSAFTAMALGVAACSPPPATAPGKPPAASSPAASLPANAPTEPIHVPPDPLDVSPSAEAFARAPKLRAKLAKSPYAYFRFINAPFSGLVCAELADFGGTAPHVPLHGDAHLEQYAVTDIGRGLTDYDDAATGPAIVDLARMATSLVLASRMRGFQEDVAVSALVDGYRAGLRGEGAPRPSVIPELRAKFRDAPLDFLDGAEKLMLSEDADPTLKGEEMRATVAALEKEIRAKQEGTPPSFFGIKHVGTFRAGIGSALERKFLARLEGGTPREEDDRIVEVKFVGQRERASCIQSRYDFDPRYLRDDIPQGSLDRFLDPVFIDAKRAWAQEWYPNFVEVEVASLPSEAALAEIARDAGSLLGREHVRGASPDNLAIDDAREARLRAAARSLAARVEVSWKRFKSAQPPAEAPAGAKPG